MTQRAHIIHPEYGTVASVTGYWTSESGIRFMGAFFADGIFANLPIEEFDVEMR